MFAAHFITDAAVTQPLPPRGGLGLPPSDDKPAEGRRAGLIASLRGFLAAHTPAFSR
jgi:hypothetical protein